MKYKIEKINYMLKHKDIKEGIIYISDEFYIRVHRCPCGCGEIIWIPIDDQRGWKLTEKDSEVTFSPSIGNFYLPCKSHYFIKNSEVVWCK